MPAELYLAAISLFGTKKFSLKIKLYVSKTIYLNFSMLVAFFVNLSQKLFAQVIIMWLL